MSTTDQHPRHLETLRASQQTADSLPAVRTLADWQRRVDSREARVGIIGLGYVGLPLTLLFAGEGFRVTGFDVDAEKVDTLNAGQSYLWRIEPEHIAGAQKKRVCRDNGVCVHRGDGRRADLCADPAKRPP